MKKSESAYILRWSKKIKAVNLLGGKCVECGTDDIFVLTFHHKDPSIKDSEANSFLNSRWSITEKEVKKCVLLCHNCHSAHHNTDESKDRRGILNKMIYLEYKDISGCERCGIVNDNNSILSFHHNDPKTKKINMSNGVRFRFNNITDLPDFITEELDKCSVLCNNCHKIEHIDIERFEKCKDAIYNLVDNYKEPAKLSTEEIHYLYYKKKLNMREIAEQLGTGKSAVHYHVHKL